MVESHRSELPRPNCRPASSKSIAPVWSSAAYAQKLHSFTHEELEDRRQENVVKNMHFADDVLKTKFLAVYVRYQERLFHVDHEIRDLTNQYVQAEYRTGWTL